jgi:hypothetical protein
VLARRRQAAVATRDARAFPGAAARTLALRVLFAGGALALLAAAVITARGLDPRDRSFLPTATTGVVVLDLSLSILDDQSGTVRRTLQQLVDADATVGLVVFSDVPYELLPPGTPASELRPVIRILTPSRSSELTTPWSDTFRSGTRISAALQLAQDMLEADRVNDGSILLVSDLETAPEDVPPLTRMVGKLRREAIEFRVVGLAPSRDARTIFGDLLQDGPFDAAPVGAASPAAGRDAGAELPTTLLVLAALSLLALALHERFAGRLALTAGAPREAA